MRPPDNTTPGISRGRFPRPNLTMRELIGLVLAVAVSNAFLSWMNPFAARNVFLFSFWNGMLALYLGFAFLQAWVRSVIRWMRTGDADPHARWPQPWTALGLAEATVIGGTMFGCSMLMLERARGSDFGGDDWLVPAAILLLGSAGGIMALRTMRKQRGNSLTGRGVEPTIEVGPRIENGETR